MMDTIYIPGHDRCTLTHKPPYDTSHFVNEGEFFDTHPGVLSTLTRYERLDGAGNVVESWERDKNGRMVDVTKRDKLYKELADAQEVLESIRGKESKHGQRDRD